jgi:L-2-hydroxyglutarate oxidase
LNSTGEKLEQVLVSRHSAVLDVAVIGGGIVGLATAHALTAAGLDVAVLEKEDRVAAHQSGNSSNVLHSGIYYAPGSLKASTVRAGRERMQRFCEEHGVLLDVCGKVVVATDEEELPRLGTLGARAEANGIVAERLGPAGLRDVEPHATGIAALHVPSAAIVEVEAADLRPSPPGVRAQAVARDGTLVADFVIRHSGRVVDVLNAPSPGATASLEIGRAISEEVIRRAAG